MGGLGNASFSTKKLTACLIGALTMFVTACSSEDLGQDVTNQEWSDHTIWQILESQHPESIELKNYIRANASTTDPDVATYVGLVQTYGPEAVRDPVNGYRLMTMACEAGHARGCRGIARPVLMNAPSYEALVQAAEMLGESCRNGIGLSCQDLALFHAQTDFPISDHKLAVQYTELSCKSQLEDHCSFSAFGLVTVDLSLARSMLTDNCNAGSDRGCYLLARANSDKELGDLDLEFALQMFDSQCQKGLVDACNGLFYQLRLTERPERLYSDSEMTTRKACAEGETDLCVHLAAYYSSDSISEPELAYKITEMECETGVGELCFWQAEKLADGIGTIANKPRAAAIFQTLCDEGDTHACQYAVLTDPNSDTLSKAAQEAKTCELGDPQSCRMAAWSYATGDKVDANRDLAEQFFVRGCDGGIAISCYDLAELYDFARWGFEENKPMAQLFYRRACEDGMDYGCKMLQ